MFHGGCVSEMTPAVSSLPVLSKPPAATTAAAFLSLFCFVCNSFIGKMSQHAPRASFNTLRYPKRIPTGWLKRKEEKEKKEEEERYMPQARRKLLKALRMSCDLSRSIADVHVDPTTLWRPTSLSSLSNVVKLLIFFSIWQISYVQRLPIKIIITYIKIRVWDKWPMVDWCTKISVRSPSLLLLPIKRHIQTGTGRLINLMMAHLTLKDRSL